MSLYYNPKVIAERISPFPGEVLVKNNEEVYPDTTVLRANYRIGKVCIINVARHFDVPFNDIGKYLLKKAGDPVKWSEIIAKRQTLMEINEIKSPVDGTIEKIDSRLGIIVIREILEQPDAPVILDIKEKIKNSMMNFKDYIIKKVGERVEYGETIAGKRFIPKIQVYTEKIVSPCAGEITKIDYDNGKIWIQKDLPTVEMKANYWGRISKIEPQYGVEIEYSGYVLECAFGTSDIAWGKLVEKGGDTKANIIFSSD